MMPRLRADRARPSHPAAAPSVAAPRRARPPRGAYRPVGPPAPGAYRWARPCPPHDPARSPAHASLGPAPGLPAGRAVRRSGSGRRRGRAGV